MLSTKKLCLPNNHFRKFNPANPLLTHWGLVRRLKKIDVFESCKLTHRGHICISKLSIIGSDNVLLPGRRQAIIGTNAAILLTETSGTIFSEIWSEIHVFSFKKMHLKMSSAKWRSYYICLDVTHDQSILGLVNLAHNHPTKWFTKNYTRHIDTSMT